MEYLEKIRKIHSGLAETLEKNKSLFRDAVAVFSLLHAVEANGHDHKSVAQNLYKTIASGKYSRGEFQSFLQGLHEIVRDGKDPTARILEHLHAAKRA
jgi:hypothetical protein